MAQNNRKDALKDYIEVNVRIEKFYEKFPNGRINTEMVSWENGVVVMKAIVYRDIDDPIDKPSATGYAYEKEGSSFINKTSALENCETSAVGRALAMLGFEIKKSIASKEEVANAKLNQDNPDEQHITPGTLGNIKKKWLELKCKPEHLNPQLKKLYKKELVDLTEKEALEFLQQLEKKESA